MFRQPFCCVPPPVTEWWMSLAHLVQQLRRLSQATVKAPAAHSPVIINALFMPILFYECLTNVIFSVLMFDFTTFILAILYYYRSRMEAFLSFHSWAMHVLLCSEEWQMFFPLGKCRWTFPHPLPTYWNQHDSFMVKLSSGEGLFTAVVTKHSVSKYFFM